MESKNLRNLRESPLSLTTNSKLKSPNSDLKRLTNKFNYLSELVTSPTSEHAHPTSKSIWQLAAAKENYFQAAAKTETRSTILSKGFCGELEEPIAA